MRALAKLLTALVLCLGSLLPAYAAPLGYDVAVLNGPPCAFPGSAIDLNFQLNAATLNCHGAGSATGLLTLTRTTVGYAQYQAGCWQQFPSGAFRITDKGLLVEEARTNSALSERDLTNAAWVKVNMTTALTATGIDCTANTATTLTATAGNATALQTIVLGSAADVFQPFIKRISGTGNVDITVDGGVTWTTQTLTTSYQQFQVTKTAANPVIGIRIVTDGDSVALDMGELQNGAYATSPVGSAATRNADQVRLATPSQVASLATGTVFAEWAEVVGPVSVARELYRITDGTNQIINRVSTANKLTYLGASGFSLGPLTSTNVVVAGTVYRNAFAYASADGALALTASLNAAVLTTGTGATSATVPTIVPIGQSQVTTELLDGYMRRFSWFPSRLSNSQILAWAQGTVGP